MFQGVGFVEGRKNIRIDTLRFGDGFEEKDSEEKERRLYFLQPDSINRNHAGARTRASFDDLGRVLVKQYRTR